MKPARHFGKLRSSGTRRLRRIREVAVGAVAPYSQERDPELAWVTIELANLWTQFCRAYFLSCLRSARLDSGPRVSCQNLANIPAFEVAMIVLAWKRGKTRAGRGGKLQGRDEPDWHQPSCLLQGCRIIGASNLHSVQGALSTGTSVFEHLPTCRNFYAHRSKETATKVLNIGLSAYSMGGKTHPSEVLIARAPGSSQSLILDFIDDTEVTIELLCD